MKYTAIILAAGSGKRTGLEENKILYKIHKKRVVDYSLNFFENDQDCVEIILVINAENILQFSDVKTTKISQVIFGGDSRQESVRNSLKYIQENYVLIHDAARPFIPKKGVEELKSLLPEYSSLSLGIKVTDTIQKVHHGYIYETLDRDILIATQTPQAFHKDKLIEAHYLALEQGFEANDDTTLLLELLNIPALFVEGDKRNIKFTRIDDLSLLEVIL